MKILSLERFGIGEFILIILKKLKIFNYDIFD